jgi:integrative and conjugative element protein (TIGR02256 family)
MKVTVNKYVFILSDEVLQTLREFRQLKENAQESGGIILGRQVNNEYYIGRLSLPTQLDKSSRTAFERNKVSGQIIIDYEFHYSKGTVNYLGEWHTHPEDIPLPSNQDLKMIGLQLNEHTLNTDFVILLIQGIEKAYFGVFNGNESDFVLL